MYRARALHTECQNFKDFFFAPQFVRSTRSLRLGILSNLVKTLFRSATFICRPVFAAFARYRTYRLYEFKVREKKIIHPLHDDPNRLKSVRFFAPPTNENAGKNGLQNSKPLLLQPFGRTCRYSPSITWVSMWACECVSGC